MKSILHHINLRSALDSKFSSISLTIFKIQIEYVSKMYNYAVHDFLSATDVIYVVVLIL